MSRITITIILLINLFSFTQEKRVRVSNSKELINVIAPNTIINLENKNYYLSNVMLSDTTPFVTLAVDNGYYNKELFDTVYEVQIHDVNNLTISGIKNGNSEIITNYNVCVLVFKNCNDITIQNVALGHGAFVGRCFSPVFFFEDCKNIKLLNVNMYGSGQLGIYARNVENITVEHSDINNCTEGAMEIYKSTNITFNHCNFYENEIDVMTISGCKNVNFNNCRIYRNRYESCYLGDISFVNIFSVYHETTVYFNNCKIENNTGLYLSNDSLAVKFNNTSFENNYYYEGKFRNNKK